MIVPLEIRAFVEQLQQSAIQRKGYLPDADKYVVATVRMFEELRVNAPARDALDVQDCWRLLQQLGPFQNPYHLFSLLQRTKAVTSAAQDLGLPVDREFTFASTTLGVLNAQVYNRAAGPVIVFNDGLMVTMELLGILFSHCFSEVARSLDGKDAGEAARRVLHREAPVVRSIIRALVSYVTTGDPRDALPGLPEEHLELDDQGAYFREQMLTAIVGHECGHVFLGHFDDARKIAHRTTASGLSFEWSTELEADEFGSQVTFHAALSRPNSDPIVACIAIECSMFALVLVSSTEDYLRHGGIRGRESNTGTHPPTDRRFAHVRDALDSYAKGRVDPHDMHIAHAMIDGIIWALLPSLRQECLALRDKGVHVLT